MKIKVITTVSDNTHPGFLKLKSSLDKFGWDYLAIHNPNINWNWGGLQDIYAWCKSAESDGYTHFLYTDGFDTLALSGPNELQYTDTECILYSGEKACFPIVAWHKDHVSPSRWKYLNHGQFIAPIDKYLKMYEGVFYLPCSCQEWAMELFLFHNDGTIKIDDGCNIFQSVAFSGPDEFSIDGNRIINNITGTKPLFPHGNGHTEFDWVYNLM